MKDIKNEFNHDELYIILSILCDLRLNFALESISLKGELSTCVDCDEISRLKRRKDICLYCKTVLDRLYNILSEGYYEI